MLQKLLHLLVFLSFSIYLLCCEREREEEEGGFCLVSEWKKRRLGMISVIQRHCFWQKGSWELQIAEGEKAFCCGGGVSLFLLNFFFFHTAVVSQREREPDMSLARTGLVFGWTLRGCLRREEKLARGRLRKRLVIRVYLGLVMKLEISTME